MSMSMSRSRSRSTPPTTPTRIPRRGSWSSSPRSCLGRTRGRARGRSTVVRREGRGRRLCRRRRVRRRRRRRRRVRRLRGRGRPRDRRRGGHRRSRGIARDETRVSEPREAREAREDPSIERTRLSRSTAPSTTPTPTTWCGDECPTSHVVSRSRRCDHLPRETFPFRPRPRGGRIRPLERPTSNHPRVRRFRATKKTAAPRNPPPAGSAVGSPRASPAAPHPPARRSHRHATTTHAH